jgi:hypothetical protein
MRKPSSEFLRVKPFMTMMKTKKTGKGTVTQTILEESLTPWKTQMKQTTQTRSWERKTSVWKVEP